MIPSPKLTASSHLKIDGWNTVCFLLGPGLFSGAMLLVLGSVTCSIVTSPTNQKRLKFNHLRSLRLHHTCYHDPRFWKVKHQQKEASAKMRESTTNLFQHTQYNQCISSIECIKPKKWMEKTDVKGLQVDDTCWTSNSRIS